MKNKMVFLTFFVNGVLMAANNSDTSCTSYCPPNSANPINCECYTPPFNMMQCDYGVYVDAEFLYWYGGESGLYYAVKTNSITADPLLVGDTPLVAVAPASYEYINPTWAPGFRIGLGGKLTDGWDTSLSWTWYKNQTTDSIAVSPFTTVFATGGNQGITLPWLNNALTPSSIGAAGTGDRETPADISFQSATTKWDLQFNQIDWNLGRKYWLSKRFAMRPYVGLRGAWSNTNFEITGFSQTTVSSVSTNSTFDQFKNENWGLGLLSGLQPSFFFMKNLSLYANADIALLWGRFEMKNKIYYTRQVTTINLATDPPTATGSFFGMQPVLDLGLGLCWETGWKEDRYRLALDAGWEHHVWFDYHSRMKPTNANGSVNSATGLDGIFNMTFEEVVSNFTLGGLVLRTRFDF